MILKIGGLIILFWLCGMEIGLMILIGWLIYQRYRKSA